MSILFRFRGLFPNVCHLLTSVRKIHFISPDLCNEEELSGAVVSMLDYGAGDPGFNPAAAKSPTGI